MKIEANILKPVLPREHGVMVIAFVPLFTAIAISYPGAEHSLSSVGLFCCSVIFFFMSFSPLTIIIKKGKAGRNLESIDRNAAWSIIYLVLSLGFFVYLLAATQLYGLLFFLILIVPVFFFYCYLLAVGKNREYFSMNLLGAAILCLIAPMAYYVSLGQMDINALMIYIINLGFFSTRIIFAKKMLNLKDNDPVLASFKTRRKYLKKVSIFNVVVIHVLVLFSILKMIPATAVTSLLPGSIYTWKQIISLKEKPDIRNVGLKEMCVALFFSAVLIFSYQ